MTTDSRRILLCEDDPLDVDLTLRALATLGLDQRVDVVHDGEKALDYLYRRGAYAERGHGDPAVIVLDIKMPRVSGIDVLKRIKADPQLRLIPVVMLTSSREQGDVDASYQSGSNAYVVKPVDYREFVSAIHTVGTFWASVNQPPRP